MTNTYGHDTHSPAIRVQQPIPVSHSTASYAQQSALADNLSYHPQSNWGAYERNGQMIARQPLQTTVLNNRRTQHQRAPSGSSIGSSNPTSPFSQGHATNLQYNYTAENSPSKVDSAFNNDTSRPYSNHLPTPTQTPTQDTFITSTTNNYYNPQQPQGFESALAAHMALNNGIDQSSTVPEEMPDISHSSRHSVSSYGQEPATPHDYYDESKGYTNDMIRQNVPKFERTMTDAYADIGYDPTTASLPQSVPQKQQHSGTFLSPWRSVVNERLQAAQNARSQSPASSLSGGVSPFRQGSPLAPTSNSFGSPRAKLGTAAHVREQQKAETDARALKQNMAQEQEAPKTISPKDVELEYHETEEDSKMPLFPDNATEYSQQYGGGNNGYANATPVKYESGYGNMATSRADNTWTSQQQNQATYPATSAAPQSNFTFQTPALPGPVHGMPFNSQSYRTAPSMTQQAEDPPEFPAHLTSMESSASEAAPPSSNNSTNNNGGEITKPASALADTGTYTCTYHGCTQRFETPQKLQRHKREAHRQAPPTTPGVGSGMSSAALLARNSQAGPHKCDRINPTTNKSCNTIFSRPYDLTRHEDTIHNVRKQKVRCALCVEDKTFSRNDALTRHMRVVHPDVDFPGKHRRRGS